MRKEEFYREALPDSIGPLEGIRVLEATHYGAGPLVGTLLADLGAEDIKCDLPGEGDILRQMGPYLEEEGGGLREGITHLSISRNKKCITLNFRTPEGQELFRELAKRVDVVVENFKPGTMEKWGLGYQDIRKVKPDIIYSSATGYGQFGPYAHRPGYDTVGLAYGGMMHITGFPDGPPVRPPNAISDNITGWLGAYATLAALLYRNRTGKGQHIDIGQVDVILYTSLGGILGAARDVFHWERGGNGSPSTAACNLYSCKDGHVYIIAISPTHWARLCRIMGREDLIDDSRTNSVEARGKNKELVDAVVADWTKEKRVAEVVGTLDEAQLVVMPILNFDQIIRNEHIRERDMVAEVEHPAFGKLPIYGVGPKFSLTPARVRSAAPLVGEIVGRLPGQVAYVAIDFVKETLEDLKKKLKEQGYDPDKKTLFVMEGLVTHIGQAAVDELLRFITSFSGTGSSMLCTYIHKGIVKELAEILKRSVFGIDPDQIENFLGERGFCQINNTPITRIQERYCKEITPIPETYFIVDAVVKGS